MDNHQQLQAELQGFAEAHVDGWNHEQWEMLLQSLRQKGIQTHDTDQIGLQLERERLALRLKRLSLKGLGPKRLDSIVDAFQTLWNLQQARPEELTEVKGVTPALANQLKEQI